MVKGWFVETVDEQRAVEEIEAESDRAAAIVIASLVENRLTDAMQATMVDAPSTKKDFFRSSGPLGSFSAKIDLAYLLGWITKEAHSDLNILRRIRNLFAHELPATRFHTNDRICQLADNFQLIETMVCAMEAEKAPVGFSFGMKVADYDELISHPRGRFMLTGRLFVAGLHANVSRFRTPINPWM